MRRLRALPARRVSHSSSLEQIKGFNARREKEEESSIGNDSQEDDEDMNEDEDEELSDTNENSEGSSESNDEDGLPSGSGLVIRIPSKRMAPTVDKPRIHKGRRLEHTHICI